MMLTAGLTGGIACGKSTVARFFAGLGCPLVDADRIARELMEPEGGAYRDVVKRFGDSILKADLSIDRGKLARIVFTDKQALADLNGIVHPSVIRREKELIEGLRREGGHPVVIVEAALMIEAGTHEAYDRLIVVHCDPGRQLERLMKRSGLTREEALSRISSQMPLEEKRQFADYEIDTSGDMRAVKKDVEEIYRKLLSERKGR